MRQKILAAVTILLFGLQVGAVCGAEIGDPISAVKLTSGSLPAGMRIAREIRASRPQLLRVRQRVGFPITALLNQVMIYQNEQAQVNYMVPYNEDWLDYGYSRLVATDGERSFILLKNEVIVQIAATSRDLEILVARLLNADPLHYCKIRSDSLPEDWRFSNERWLPRKEVLQLSRNLDAEVRSALEQEFIADRQKMKIKYYNCGTEQAAESVALRIAQKTTPLLKRLAQPVGPLVVEVESQDGRLNSRAMELLDLRRSSAELVPWNERR